MENKVIEKVLKAENESEKMIEEAKLQATKILQNAETKAENIKAKAVEENKKAIKQSKIETEEIEKQSYLEKLDEYARQCNQNSSKGENFGKLAEGYFTLKAVKNIADKENISMPICQALYKAVYENADVKQTIRAMFERDLKHEFEQF